jgi:hypothetical protein
MNRQPFLILVIALGILLAACGPSATPISTSTFTSQPTSTPTLRLTETLKPASTATASPAPAMLFQELSKNWRVAYWDYENDQVCAMNGDGSGKLCTPLLDAYQFSGGSWSPDGDRLVFYAGYGLYIWRLDGGITHFRVSSGTAIMEPDWSPDGNYIVFVSTELERSLGQHNAMDIFVDNLDGTTHRNITRYLEDKSDSRNPDWSPDGSLIVFDSNGIKPNPNYPIDPWSHIPDDAEIYVVSPEGSDPIRLTYNEAEDVEPVWSPDGRQIAFLSDRGGSFDLYIMNADGTDTRQAVSLALDNPRWDGEFSYSWLPDGKFILFGDRLIELETGKLTQLQFAFSDSAGFWLMTSEPAAIVPIPTPHCAYGWSQLFTDQYAVVSGGANDPPNRVRAGSTKTDEIIAQIYPGTIVKIFEGPVCTDGFVFWKVENASIPGGSGWTAEGDGTEYWLEPYEP